MLDTWNHLLRAFMRRGMMLLSTSNGNSDGKFCFKVLWLKCLGGNHGWTTNDVKSFHHDQVCGQLVWVGFLTLATT